MKKILMVLSVCACLSICVISSACADAGEMLRDRIYAAIESFDETKTDMDLSDDSDDEISDMVVSYDLDSEKPRVYGTCSMSYTRKKNITAEDWSYEREENMRNVFLNGIHILSQALTEASYSAPIDWNRYVDEIKNAGYINASQEGVFVHWAESDQIHWCLLPSWICKPEDTNPYLNLIYCYVRRVDLSDPEQPKYTMYLFEDPETVRDLLAYMYEYNKDSFSKKENEAILTLCWWLDKTLPNQVFKEIKENVLLDKLQEISNDLTAHKIDLAFDGEDGREFVLSIDPNQKLERLFGTCSVQSVVYTDEQVEDWTFETERAKTIEFMNILISLSYALEKSSYPAPMDENKYYTDARENGFGIRFLEQALVHVKKSDQVHWLVLPCVLTNDDGVIYENSIYCYVRRIDMTESGKIVSTSYMLSDQAIVRDVLQCAYDEPNKERMTQEGEQILLDFCSIIDVVRENEQKL